MFCAAAAAVPLPGTPQFEYHSGDCQLGVDGNIHSSASGGALVRTRPGVAVQALKVHTDPRHTSEAGLCASGWAPVSLDTPSESRIQECSTS